MGDRISPSLPVRASMPAYNLRQLHQRTVAVEFTAFQEPRVIRGDGRFVERGECGPALHVEVKDVHGDFEFVFNAKQWLGRIDSGERFGCDFAIRAWGPAPAGSCPAANCDQAYG